MGLRLGPVHLPRLTAQTVLLLLIMMVQRLLVRGVTEALGMMWCLLG
jgi:hypothetical protein